MRIAAILILAFAILAAPVLWHVSGLYLAPESTAPDDSGADRLARIEERLQVLEDRVDGLDARSALRLGRDEDAPEETDRVETSDSLKDAFAQVVLIANRRNVNEGLTLAGSSFLLEFLGPPRENLTDECQPMTSPTLAPLLKLEDVGPIKAKMLLPALISIRQVFANVQVYEPELYKRIQSAGSLCVRRIRGSDHAVSTHSYGLAIDINIDGVLDTLGDGKTQLGLTLLADFFKREGWIWGAGFSREDSMHFEVSREKLLQWRRLGQI